MIIAQVCLRLATIKGHFKMCSFITQHNATDVTSFEGLCNYDSMFLFLPISSNFTQPLKRSGPTLQATINNLINSMRRRCVALREANDGHNRN